MGIELKRLYDPDEIVTYKAVKEARIKEIAEALLSAGMDKEEAEALARKADLKIPSPVPIGVEVHRIIPKQGFPTETVQAGLAQGWMSVGRKKLTIHGSNGEVVYKILYEPGRWCCHCDAKLPDDPQGRAARAHVASTHGNKPSPDPQYPAGYLCDNYYECELESAPDELLE